KFEKQSWSARLRRVLVSAATRLPAIIALVYAIDRSERGPLTTGLSLRARSVPLFAVVACAAEPNAAEQTCRPERFPLDCIWHPANLLSPSARKSSLMLLTIISFLFFTGLVGVLTWLITRKDDHSSTSGYFLAGRTLTFPLIAGSLLLTNLSTEQM